MVKIPPSKGVLHPIHTTALPSHNSLGTESLHRNLCYMGTGSIYLVSHSLQHKRSDFVRVLKSEQLLPETAFAKAVPGAKEKQEAVNYT